MMIVNSLTVSIYSSTLSFVTMSTHFCLLFCIVFFNTCAAACLVTGTANDGGEDGPGGIVSGEPSLHKAGAVVAHKGGSFFVVTHVGF